MMKRDRRSAFVFQVFPFSFFNLHSPSFHLEFRYALFYGMIDESIFPYSRLHKVVYSILFYVMFEKTLTLDSIMYHKISRN